MRARAQRVCVRAYARAAVGVQARARKGAARAAQRGGKENGRGGEEEEGVVLGVGNAWRPKRNAERERGVWHKGVGMWGNVCKGGQAVGEVCPMGVCKGMF